LIGPAVILILLGVFLPLNNAGALGDQELETAAMLLGLFFFLFTLNVELPFEFENLAGPVDWDDSAYLLPAYPLIGGILLS
jgi:hypothetical protein